jgi:Outer membrane protein beta-barrel domain
MKRSRFYLIAVLFIAFASNAQITKGNWMMGGSASFGNSKTTIGEISGESTGFGLSPNVGYFIIDKLAIGTSGQFSYSFPSGNQRTIHSYTISPFVRYYFLEKEKQINIFSEAGYEIMRISNGDSKSDKLHLKAGAVFFLNSSVGLEVALNYSNQKTNDNYQVRNIYLGVGFQIHLEREK